MIRHSFLLLLMSTCLSCAIFKPSATDYELGYKGALKSIMHEGDISAKADLVDFKNKKHLYALGAAENLKGEILIMNSKPFIASVKNEILTIDNSFHQKAALFVYAAVKAWRTFDMPDDVTTYGELESYVEKTAFDYGIDVDEPFPFLLMGDVHSLDWHVIDWPAGDTEHTHEKHIQSGLHDTISDQAVEILGFYSRHHHAIFTHHTTNMHMHFKTLDNTLSGHVDDLMVGQSLTLLLPFLHL